MTRLAAVSFLVVVSLTASAGSVLLSLQPAARNGAETSAARRKRVMIPPAIAAGTIVSPGGLAPARTPVRRRIPPMTRARR